MAHLATTRLSDHTRNSGGTQSKKKHFFVLTADDHVAVGL